MMRPEMSFRLSSTGLVPLLMVAMGCGGEGDSVDAGARDGGGGHDAGQACTQWEPAEICVRGTADSDGESLEAGEPVRIQLRPEGCHSSSCTIVEEASCAAVLEGTGIDVTGAFCLADREPDGEQTCTPDCGGGGAADCATEAGLDAGDYTATVGELAVRFTVPSTIPVGGACDQAR